MPVVIPTGFAKVTHMIATPSTGGAHVSTLNYGITALPSQGVADAIANEFFNLWANIGSDSADLFRTVVRDEISAFESDVAGSGDNALILPPPQIAVLGKKVTGLLGRHNRGRLYFPCVVSNAAIDATGNIDTLQVSNIETDVNAWLTSLTTAVGEMVILHSTELPPTPVTRISIEETVATQRRRLKRPSS